MAQEQILCHYRQRDERTNKKPIWIRVLRCPVPTAAARHATYATQDSQVAPAGRTESASARCLRCAQGAIPQESLLQLDVNVYCVQTVEETVEHLP